MKNRFLVNLMWGALLVLPFLMSCGQAPKTKTTQAENAVVTKSAAHPGELMYKRHCLSCHQRDAGGVPGMYPPLMNNKTISGDKNKLIDIVLNGMSGPIEVNGEKYNGIMASYRNLTDQEIADILNYLRSGFGNSGESVSPEDVKRLR